MSRVLDLGTRIAPFGEPVALVPFLGRTLGELREEEIRRAQVPPERLCFADYALATAPVLADFARLAPAGQPSVLALPATSPSASLAPVSSVRRAGELLFYDVFLDAPASASLEELRSVARPVRVEAASRTRTLELPRLGPPPHTLELIDDGVLALHVEHWVHVLWAQPALVGALLARGVESGYRSVRGPRGTAPSLVAKDARVHRTAHLEGSVIGPGAVVNARASIRHSYVGARSTLADFTKLTRSVVGNETHTLVDANFYDVVSLGKGTITSWMLRDTLLGQSVFLTSAVIFWNSDLGQDIQVEHQGERRSTGRRFLGGCAGHGCVLGARTIVAPGLALPNRTTVVMRREEGVLRFEPAPASTPMCWYDAKLVPVTVGWPGYVPDEVVRGGQAGAIGGQE